MRIAIVEDESALAEELHALLQKLGTYVIDRSVFQRRTVFIRMG